MQLGAEVVHTANPSAQEAKADRSLSSRTPCLKKPNQTNEQKVHECSKDQEKPNNAQQKEY